MLLNEDHSNIEFVGESFTFACASGPDTCSETEACVVSDMDRLLDICYAEQRGDGPEELFTIGGRTERNVGQDGWCIKNPGRSSGLPRVSRRPPASTVLRTSSCRDFRLPLP
jgi:hypothetical protein